MTEEEKPAFRFGRLITRLRELKRWNQREFARRLGMPPATVSAWETGRSMPQVETLKKIAEVLDTTVGNLMREAGVQTLDDEQAPLAHGPASSLPDVPVYRYEGAEFDNDGRVGTKLVGHVARATDNPDPRSYGLLVEGNDLYPRVWPGDVVIVTTAGAPEPGDLSVAQRRGEHSARIVRVGYPRRGVFVASPLNPALEPEEHQLSDFLLHRVMSIRPKGQLRRTVEGEE